MTPELLVIKAAQIYKPRYVEKEYSSILVQLLLVYVLGVHCVHMSTNEKIYRCIFLAAIEVHLGTHKYYWLI